MALTETITVLRLIPEVPELRPADRAIESAVVLLRQLLPQAEVTARTAAGIEFVGPGIESEEVDCPFCGSTLTSAWKQWLDTLRPTSYRNRMVDLPCCGRELDMNDLDYRSPAGFAKLIIQIETKPGDACLDEAVQQRIEEVLGCRVRQVIANQ